jgi:hypothetical protein
LLSHFVNHAFGNISLDALAIGLRYHTRLPLDVDKVCGPVPLGGYSASRRLCSNSSISFANLIEVVGSDTAPDSRRHCSSFLSSCSRSRC